MRSLQSMFIAASTLGHTIQIICGGEIDYSGKNPRDAFQAVRGVEEANVYLINEQGIVIDEAHILPYEDDYMADCSCNGFFDKWSS
jgi:hypothetical protein